MFLGAVLGLSLTLNWKNPTRHQINTWNKTVNTANSGLAGILSLCCWRAFKPRCVQEPNVDVITVEKVGLRAVAMMVPGLLLLLARSFTSCSPIPLLEPVISTDLHKLADIMTVSPPTGPPADKRDHACGWMLTSVMLVNLGINIQTGCCCLREILVKYCLCLGWKSPFEACTVEILHAQIKHCLTEANVKQAHFKNTATWSTTITFATVTCN